MYWLIGGSGQSGTLQLAGMRHGGLEIGLLSPLLRATGTRCSDF